MSNVNRRDALKVFGVAPLAGMLDWSAPTVDRATVGSTQERRTQGVTGA